MIGEMQRSRPLPRAWKDCSFSTGRQEERRPVLFGPFPHPLQPAPLPQPLVPPAPPPPPLQPPHLPPPPVRPSPRPDVTPNKSPFMEIGSRICGNRLDPGRGGRVEGEMETPDLRMNSHRQAAGSEVTSRLSAPAFYGPQKKFGPVVAPKPKVNPYRPAGRTDPGPSEVRLKPGATVTPASGSRSCLGRVGEIPGCISAEDLPPPPPPADDVEAWPGLGFLSPPPPPPPFEDSFPPPPADEQFPTPPSPLAEEQTLMVGTEMPRRDENTLESEINSLTNLIKDMENMDTPRVTDCPSHPSGQGQVFCEPPASKFSPKAPAKAPKPQFPLPKAQPWAPGSLSVGTEPRPNLQARPGAGSLKSGRAGRPGDRDETQPRGQQKAPSGESFLATGASNREVRPSGGDSAPMSYKDVQELEKLARNFMEEMDKIPQEISTEVCGQCGKDVLRSQAAVKALGRVFHADCFTCSSCRDPLQGLQFYEVDGKPLCPACHLETLEKCAICRRPITERMLRATGQAFHPECFSCASCHRSLEGQAFISGPDGDILCVADYHRRYSPWCSVCGEPIIPEEGKGETVRILALDKNFHVRCYRCEDCGTQLSTEADEKGCYPLDGHVLCLSCHTGRLSKKSQP